MIEIIAWLAGIDKVSPEENLRDFVSGDLDDFRKKYPDFKYNHCNIRYIREL